ncbi:hypothetical protein MYXA107069_35080 [Myxococcus xanthus]|nr:hypothetical protein MyxoNM_09550 [Myxococcus xanthus]SDY26023.1 hypothetical protein SAMN05444383_12831 [Myxococcus xanthus]
MESKVETEERVLLGVPSECPRPNFHFAPPGGCDHLLGFKFPSIPGIPPVRDALAKRFSAGSIDETGKLGRMPKEEWKTHLSVLCGEFRRAEYHLSRFGAALELLKSRRRLAGGPTVGDPEPARALYCEAAGYLSAMRTAVDIIVYVAARRAGASVADAEDWKAARAICAPSASLPTKYRTDDIRALRRHKDWFETLNHYRNCMTHRGWHEHSFGYFDRSDNTPQANNPFHNIMLVPDLGPLRQGARPDKWTYRERRWLDALVHAIESGALAALEDLLNAWELPETQPGRIPEEEQATVFLTVPFVPWVIDAKSPPVLHVFLSEDAARLFFEDFRKKSEEFRTFSFREVRRMKLQDDGDGYLVAYHSESLKSSAEVHLHTVLSEKDHVIAKVGFCPSADNNGPSKGLLWFRTPDLNLESVFVFSHAGR